MVTWKLIAALNGGTCAIDQWEPMYFARPRRSTLNCDLIAAAMRAAGAEPHHWYIVRLDLEPDGTVVGEAHLTMCGLPTYRDGEPSLSEGPERYPTHELDLTSFCISQGFEAGKPSDFAAAPPLQPDGMWTQGPDGWISVSVPAKDNTPGRP